MITKMIRDIENEYEQNILLNDHRLIPGLPFYKEPYLEFNRYRGVKQYIFENVHSWFEQYYIDELTRLDII